MESDGFINQVKLGETVWRQDLLDTNRGPFGQTTQAQTNMKIGLLGFEKLDSLSRLDQIWSGMHFGAQVVRIMLDFFELFELRYQSTMCHGYFFSIAPQMVLADIGPINSIHMSCGTVLSTPSHDMHTHSSNCEPWQSVVLSSTWTCFYCFVQQIGSSCRWDQDQTKKNNTQFTNRHADSKSQHLTETVGIAIGNM